MILQAAKNFISFSAFLQDSRHSQYVLVRSAERAVELNRREPQL